MVASCAAATSDAPSVASCAAYGAHVVAALALAIAAAYWATSEAQHGDSWGTPVVSVLGVAASTARPHGAAIPPIQEDESAASTSATDGSNLMPLLPLHHHIEVLDTEVTPEMKEIDRVVMFAAPIGQTR
jgi:hypothetical protein